MSSGRATLLLKQERRASVAMEGCFMKSHLAASYAAARSTA